MARRTRRDLLKGGLGAAAFAGLSAAGLRGARAQAESEAAPADAAPPVAAEPYLPNQEPLQLGKLAGEHGILYGGAISADRLPQSELLWDYSPYPQLYERQAAIITNAFLHFDLTEPVQGRFDYTTPDRIAHFAANENIHMRGHALCWHERVPDWMAGMDRGQATNAIENHVRNVVSHYAGRMHSWDVVNEGINPGDGAPGFLRNSAFTRMIGYDWMAVPFHAARAADPQALLTYNEYRVEITHYGDADDRRAGLLGLLDDFRKRSIPIDAIGIQSHLDYGAWRYFNATAFSDFLSAVAQRGVKIFLSELDVNDVGTPTPIAQRDAVIADIYKEYLETALANPAVEVVVSWGLFDQESWQNSASGMADNPGFVRPDGTLGRGLPFDGGMKPKLAAQAMAGTFQAAMPR